VAALERGGGELMATDSPATNTLLGDQVHERAHALDDAVSRVSAGLCTVLDGPETPHHQEALEDYEEAVSDLKTEWQRFTTTMDSALQRIEGGPDG
jgi:hypothetical protein